MEPPPFDWGGKETTPRYLTIQFVDASGKVVLTITDVPITFATDNSSVAQTKYTYDTPYPDLTIKASFAGDDFNQPASGSTKTDVSKAPVI